MAEEVEASVLARIVPSVFTGALVSSGAVVSTGVALSTGVLSRRALVSIRGANGPYPWGLFTGVLGNNPDPILPEFPCKDPAHKHTSFHPHPYFHNTSPLNSNYKVYPSASSHVYVTGM